jgi:hypothetical protein
LLFLWSFVGACSFDDSTAITILTGAERKQRSGNYLNI